MSRPEGVTAEAWDEVQMMLQETLDDVWYVPDHLTAAVARAITAAVAAEREACALVAADYHDHPSELAAFVGEEIADAIRARSES